MCCYRRRPPHPSRRTALSNRYRTQRQNDGAAIVAGTHIGTYACARVPQALSASGSTQHVARGRPLLGDTQLAFRRLLEPQFPVLGDEA